MNRLDGTVMAEETLRKHMGEEAFKRFGKPVDPIKMMKHHVQQLENAGMAKVGRNARCPCGSGKKFKACCERTALT